jgi:hypothetical protein
MSFIESPNVLNPAIEGDTKLLSRLWSGWFVRLAEGLNGIPEHADNAAAVAAGVRAGRFYRTGDALKVVHE